VAGLVEIVSKPAEEEASKVVYDIELDESSCGDKNAPVSAAVRRQQKGGLRGR